MTNFLVPPYLSSLVPESIDDVTPYYLRNGPNTRNIHCNTQFFSKSFLHSTISEWNQLPVEVRNAESIAIFKNKLISTISKVPSYYYHGSRKSQILHTRLRTHCSILKEDLFSKNIIDDPFCQCGEIGDSYHFFFNCNRFSRQRNILKDELQQITTVTLSTLLYGDSCLSDETNAKIFKLVHEYISSTKRFDLA